MPRVASRPKPSAALLQALPNARLNLALRKRYAQGVKPLWSPLPGPQTMALASQADELYYGGSAGGGKTDMILGAAITQHHHSIIFRREYPQLRGIQERARELLSDQGSYNGSEHIWRLSGGRMIEFGAMQLESDKDNYQGRPHDLVAFDEGPQFLESQYTFVTAWARTTRPGQRVRIILSGNPPTDSEGEWVIRRWAPWLDASHPDPAEPGELRWYAMLDHGDGTGARDTECGSSDPFEWNGETVYPISRTFIPARLDDNPHLLATGYRSRLQGLPEPLRSQLLYGDFTVGTTDDPWQVIPTEWVRQAQARWRPDGHPMGLDGKPIPLSRVGIDIAQGGSDSTVLAKRYQNWWAPFEVHAGTSTPDANVNATLVLAAMGAEGLGTIDANGIGSSTYWLVRAKLGNRLTQFLGHMPTEMRDRAGVLTFANLRAAGYWTLREWLDPVNGYNCALPPGRELLADLTAPRWKTTASGILLEKKEAIKVRLGRSPDYGDAVVNSIVAVTSNVPEKVTFGG